MLVELRSTGAQTVFPPSTHETGETIQWEAEDAPAEVDPQELLDAVKRLADTVKIELGEKPAKAPNQKKDKAAPAPPAADIKRHAADYCLPDAYDPESPRSVASGWQSVAFGVRAGEPALAMRPPARRLRPP